MTNAYGTKEFYAEQFADLIADVQHDSPEFSNNLIAGFLLALDDWRQYHVKQILELDRVEFKATDNLKQFKND
tara:strand:- start:509 stop:727 length:219 start_codon:yes stop_codon:yes gene_type:complete